MQLDVRLKESFHRFVGASKCRDDISRRHFSRLTGVWLIFKDSRGSIAQSRLLFGHEGESFSVHSDST